MGRAYLDCLRRCETRKNTWRNGAAYVSMRASLALLGPPSAGVARGPGGGRRGGR